MRYFYFILFIFIFVSCHSGRKVYKLEDKAKKFIPSKGRGGLYIYNEYANLPGVKIYNDIWVNNTKIGKLDKCSFFWLNLKPGVYKISASDISKEIKFKIIENENIYIKYIPQMKEIDQSDLSFLNNYGLVGSIAGAMIKAGTTKAGKKEMFPEQLYIMDKWVAEKKIIPCDLFKRYGKNLKEK